MTKEFFSHFLKDIDDLEIFSLTKDFGNLTLDDDQSHKSSPIPFFNYRSSIYRFLRNFHHSSLNKSINEFLQAPFLEIPRQFVNDSLDLSNNFFMTFGFRFHPDQIKFLRREIHLPESFESLHLIRESLGLSYIGIGSLSSSSMLASSSDGVVSDGSKILVESITQYNGYYGRFLVLVILGLGCTVWYGFEKGGSHPPFSSSLFNPLDSYDSFFNMDHYEAPFHKITIVERKDVSSLVMSSLNEKPFADMQIPASGNTLKAVGLGLMLSFFMSVSQEVLNNII